MSKEHPREPHAISSFPWWGHICLLLGGGTSLAFRFGLAGISEDQLLLENLLVAFGGGLAITAFGLVVAVAPATIGRLMSGQWPRWAYWPAYPAALLMLYFSVLGAKVPSEHGSDTGHFFSPEGCEFRVRFPIEPHYRTLYLADGTDYLEASVTLPSGDHARAECVVTPLEWDWVPSEQATADWIASLRAYFDAYGVDPLDAGIRWASIRERTRVIEGTGTKSVAGTRMMYNAAFFVGDTSVLTILSGGPASQFPTREASAFLNSVEESNVPRR